VPSAEPARDRLIEDHLGLARRLARRHAGRGEALDDLEQVGAVALIHAVDRFDARRGVPFEAYAAAIIQGELQCHLRDRSTVVRIPRRVRRERPLAAVEPLPLPDAQPAPADALGAAEARLDLRNAIARLDAREQRAVALRYLVDLPRAEVARRLGLSEVTTARVLRHALSTLAGALADRPIAGRPPAA
jgi:RNA polymerase sigma-B factor